MARDRTARNLSCGRNLAKIDTATTNQAALIGKKPVSNRSIDATSASAAYRFLEYSGFFNGIDSKQPQIAPVIGLSSIQLSLLLEKDRSQRGGVLCIIEDRTDPLRVKPNSNMITICWSWCQLNISAAYLRQVDNKTPTKSSIFYKG